MLTSTGDHPRVCGEHFTEPTNKAFDLGSPPRMRGTLLAHFNFNIMCGITPAYAGNTTSSSASAVTVPDHPRVCGEHIALLMARN